MKKRNFVRKKVKSLTLGEKLQQLRESRRMRVQDLSCKINVKVSYIEALEKGNYDKLPTRVYVKGFVRSYARFFNVKEKILLDLFDREYSVYQNIYKKDVEETVSRLPKMPKFIFTPRVLVIIIGLILLSLVSIYLYFSVDNFISSPWLVIEEPLDNSVIKTDEVIIKGKTRNNSQVFINGQQTFVDMDGMFSDTIGLSNGMNVINVKSINKFEKESVKEIIVNAEFEVKQETKEEEKKQVSIIVKAKEEPVWINVVADDVDVFNDTLQLDEEKQFEADTNILMTSSNGSNTWVSFDGGETFEQISDNDDIVRDWLYEGEKVEENQKDKQSE